MRAALVVLLAGSVVGLSACAKNKVANLPPPATVAADHGTGTPIEAEGASFAPGSQADLIARIGSDRVLFAYDSYDLSDDARSALLRQAEWLRNYPQVALVIEGHADERGTREYNLALGERRANAVKNHLAALGISLNRLRTISFGKERPEVQGSAEEFYAQNRRAVSVVANGGTS